MSRSRDALVLMLLAATPAWGQGRPALPEEIAAWDIDVRPDGLGLPPGSGSVAEGAVLYDARCAACHGAFGEGVDRWPALAGGQGSLAGDHPQRTVGSYWPHATTLFDYIRRAMPFGDARSLGDGEVYALTAYVLYLNDVVGEAAVLSRDTLPAIALPNAAGFVPDGRGSEPGATACMAACAPGPAVIVRRRGAP